MAMAKKKKKTEEVKQEEKNVKDEEKEDNKQNNEECNEDLKEQKETAKEKNESLEEGKEESDKKIEEINNKLLRLQADFLNYKTRTEKEKIKYYNDAVEDLVCEMLPILDNFERALENKESDENLFKGVEMILNQFKAMLKKFGVKEIEALGKKFDTNLHHGVTTEETEEDEDIVLEVFQKGYKLKDKVIRPSMVKISK